jgi:hypothetical protein
VEEVENRIGWGGGEVGHVTEEGREGVYASALRIYVIEIGSSDSPFRSTRTHMCTRMHPLQSMSIHTELEPGEIPRIALNNLLPILGCLRLIRK